MTTEQTSIILETISFFLVTLDLFGKERLAKFYRRIRAKLTTAENNLNKFIGSKIAIILAVGIGVVIVLVMLLLYFLFPYILHKFSHRMPFLPGCLILLAIIMLSFRVSIYAFLYLLDGTLSILYFTLGNLIRFFDRYRLEGVMLTIGTILFVISKIIIF